MPARLFKTLSAFAGENICLKEEQTKMFLSFAGHMFEMNNFTEEKLEQSIIKLPEATIMMSEEL